MKYLRIFTLAVLIVIVCNPCPTAQATDNSHHGIERYMDLYNSPISQDIVDLFHDKHQPQTVDYGLVRVTFEEIVYDGRWVYTSATVVPSDEANVIVMPGSTGTGDAVAGGNGEQLCIDTRSFRDVATENQQQLLAVYVYIKEFDEMAPYYFLDHFQAEDNSSILLSGAPLSSDRNDLTLNWSVQLYNVDTSTGAYSLVDLYEYPVTVSTLAPTTVRTYTSNVSSDMPFSTITLMKTALTTYAIPDWKDEEDQGRYDLILLNESQEPYGQGTPPDINTFDIERLPETLNLVLIDYTDESILGATYICGK